MRVSFKISKKGVRFHSKPKPESPSVPEDNVEEVDAPPQLPKIQLPTTRKKRSVDVTKDDAEILDAEVSFILNIFPDGYSIENPSEGNVGYQNAVQDGSKFLHPYDRTSESLFTAIECGRLPTDFLDDIPCKYRNGTVLCEVRDYRTDSSEPGINGPSTVASPSITKVSLKMSLDNVVKDITQISDSAWSYGDLLEFESRILKALNPRLCLDPTPNLDRLCMDPTSLKLNLNIHDLRRKRLRQMSGADTASEGKILLDRVPENSSLRLGDSRPILHQPATRPKNHVPDASIPAVSHQLKSQIGVGNSRHMQDHVFNTPIVSSAQDMMSSCTDDITSIISSVLGKRGNQDGHSSSIANLNNRGRSNPMVLDGNQQQKIDSSNAPESRWKNTLIQQQQSTGGGVQYPNVGMQNHPQQMFDGIYNQVTGAMPFALGQQGIRYNLKQEPAEAERMEQSQLQQRLPQQFTRSNFVQAPCNMGQILGNNNRKDEQFQRPTPAQSPHNSAAGGLHREFSSGSMGMQFGAAACQKKSVVTSGPAVGGTRSLTCSTNYLMQQQHQAHVAENWRSNSFPRTPVVGGVGSPSSVGCMSGPFSASSPVGKEADRSMCDRFSKIEALTARFQLNSKKNKIDEYKRTTTFPTQQLIHCLFNDHNNEALIDETCKMPLSKSHVCGNMNICKTRVLKFVQPEHLFQGNGVSLPPNLQTRMILTEKPSDGTVTLYYGDLDDYDYSEDERLPTLPNTHTADLFAAQFCSLMAREGYQLESDHLQPKPINMVQSSGGEIQQIPESVSGGSTNEVVKPSNGGNGNAGGIISSSNNMPSARMQPQGNAHMLSQGRLLPSGVSMPSEPESSLYQLQQQQQRNPHSLMQQQLQRSSAMMLTSHLNGMGQNLNMQQQLGNHNMATASPLQLQLLQQQRKTMIAGNNMVGLQGLGNVIGMGMGGARAGTGMVSPMSAGMGQNPMSINQASTLSNAITQQLRSGQLTPAHAAAIMATKLRVAQTQSKTNVPVGLQGANRQIHPASSGFSMLGSGINRATNDMQRNFMAPPNMMSGPGMNQNLYMNQQQLHLQQQMQHHLQQQEPTSQLQSVLSPPPQQVGSSLIGMPQQRASPQPTPMSPQISSGAIHPLTQDAAAPASPQTLGFVGTMTYSPT